MRIQQLLKQGRKSRFKKKTNKLIKCPQKKGNCIKVFTIGPRKPNSAIRKVAKVILSNYEVITAFIPGEKHNLQEHASVLIRGGKSKDLPGVKYKVIRGAFDCSGVIGRKTSRSKYGVKKLYN